MTRLRARPRREAAGPGAGPGTAEGPARKLVYILNSYSPGEATHFHHVLGLLDALADRGVQVTLVIEKAASIPVFHNPGVEVRPLRAATPVRRAAELYRVVRELCARGYSRIFVRIAAPATLVAVAASRRSGARVYLWQSGTTLEFDRAQPWSAARVRALFRSRIPNLLARRLTDHLVSGPASMLEYYATVGGVKRDKLVLLYNDVNTATYRPPPADVAGALRREAERRHGIPAGHRVLLFVHRLSSVRRTRLYFPYLVRQLEERFGIRDLVVLVAGGGPELDAVVAEAGALGVADRCRFLGSVPNAELPPLYQVADVFIHPTYNEGFPRVILEGMAAGLPIVTTNAGGTAELLGPLQQDFIVDRDDRDGFVERVARLLGSPATRASLARENLETVQRYATDVVAEMYDSVLFG